MAFRRNRATISRHWPILIGDIQLDAERHFVEKHGKTVYLTTKECDMLHFLMANAGKVLAHSKLLRTIWGPEFENEVEYLQTFVRQIRMKIEDDPANPRYLLTELNIGYRFSDALSKRD